MRIELQSLQLENFKGIKNLKIEFSHQTTISGCNASGKSTIFDAFCYLLFGKDSKGSADFSIKTNLPDGTPIPKLDHSVEGTLTVDGQPLTLKRVYRETWQRRRGSDESEMTGHESLFYKNGVPLQAGQYKAEIGSLIDESLFKLITSATYFNSLPWQKRREVLIKIAGEISNDDILHSLTKAHVKDLTTILNSGKTLDQYRKEVAVIKKKLSDDLKLIPARVDEVKRAIPEPVDFEATRKDIYDKGVVLLEIETTITDQVKAYQEQADKIQAVRDQINNLRKQLNQIEFDVTSEAQKGKNERELKVSDLQQKITTAARQLKEQQRIQSENTSTVIPNLEKRIVELRQKWTTESGTEITFVDGLFVCPTCKQDLPDDQAENQRVQMTANFEHSKTQTLTQINAEGKQLSERLTNAKNDADIAGESVDKLQIFITGLESSLSLIPEPADPGPVTFGMEHEIIIGQIGELELKVLEVPKLDIEGLKQQKSLVQSEIDTLKAALTKEDVIKRGNARVKELLVQEKSLAQQISDIERVEFGCDAFTRSQMNMVESRVNGKFSLVKFRMFTTLVNGGIEEACECLVGGVPYDSGLNSAGKTQAGLDIIRTLSDHYGVSCPVVIDNREGCTEIPEMNCQIINLYVNPEDKELRIS